MQTVGEALRKERERQGLTLKDIETSTNIRTLYIEAIEQDNYSILPGEAYVKGFIRNYAVALGLNGSEYVEIYRKSQLPTNETFVSSGISKENTTQEVVTVNTKSEQDLSLLKKRRNKSKKNEYLWLIILLVIVVASAIVYILKNDTPKQEPPQVQPSQATQLAPPINPQSNVAQAQITTDKDRQQLTLTAKILDRTWLQVLVDGKEVFQGIPKVGETISWQAKQIISLKAGNAGGVELIYNGKSLGKFGKTGEVLLKDFLP